jgi:hypothetical protein
VEIRSWFVHLAGAETVVVARCFIGLSFPHPPKLPSQTEKHLSLPHLPKLPSQTDRQTVLSELIYYILSTKFK